MKKSNQDFQKQYSLNNPGESDSDDDNDDLVQFGGAFGKRESRQMISVNMQSSAEAENMTG